MQEVPSAPDRVIVVGDFEGYSPDELFDHWVTPELIIQWWPNVAEIQAWKGGEYCLTWPKMDWHLRGKYEAFERGEHLAFTWSWDHGPKGYEPLLVDLWFHPLENGTRLGIHHGPFEMTKEDQEARQGIIEGWIHFGMRLAGLRTGEAT